MKLDPHVKRSLHCAGLRGWFGLRKLAKIQASIRAMLFAHACGATFRSQPLGKEKH